MTSRPTRQLGQFDSTCLIVGIIIGAGIYRLAPDIAQGVGGPVTLMALWVLGGILSLCGAMSYAELATTYPEEGGDYVFLSRAYGSTAGFLFGWAQLAIVRPGDIAVMAFIFATYAAALWDPFAGTAVADGQQVYAVSATLALTLINVWGVRQGKWTQNLLTVAKAAGLLLVVVAALMVRPPTTATVATEAGLPFTLALIFVLFTYGGWNEMAYVAAEVRDPRRNIVRALITGTAVVTVLYLLVNLAFLHALGFEGMRNSQAVASDSVARALPALGPGLISVLICVSALGALNGLIFAGARISYAVGQDHPMFHGLGRWHPGLGTPSNALLMQGGIALLLILLLGSAIDAILYTAAVVYSFYCASTIAVLVLRRKEPGADRPFRVPGYPWTPLVFAGVCLFLIQSAVRYKPTVALAGCGLLLLGFPLLAWSNRMARGKSRST